MSRRSYNLPVRRGAAPAARAQILDVADRGRAYREPARHYAAPSASSAMAIVAAPISPASAPSSAAATGVRFIGGSARADSSARAGSSSRSPARLAPPPITITSGSKVFARLESAAPGRLIAGQARIGDHPAVQRVAAAERSSELRVGCVLGGGESLARDRGARCERLHAAAVGAIALAAGAVGVDHRVPELGAGARGATIQPPVDDQPAAYPGPDR